MKILALSGSPRKKGNTIDLLKEALKGAEKEGAEVDLVGVAGKELRGCDGCFVCFTKGKCHIKDDMHLIHDKMVAADGIIFGTPVYLYGMTAQMKAVLDRTFGLHGPERSLANKVGGALVVAGSVGVIDPLKDFYFLFAVNRMLAANSVGAYANNAGDAAGLVKGLEASFNLGREMVQLVNKKFEYPSEFPFNFFAYGTHTH
jgi:multimeric flavodoxin WrbA